MSTYMICTNYDLLSCKVSPKWRDKSTTCQAVKTPYIPNDKKLALSSTLIYTSCKHVRCTEKLLKIKSKLILIPFFFFLSSKCCM